MDDVEQPESPVPHRPPGLARGDYFLLWGGLVVWLVTFLSGTLIDSAPFRDRLTSVSGPLTLFLRDALVVIGTYTYTNVAIL